MCWRRDEPRTSRRVLTVDAYLASRRVIEAAEELDDGALAGAGLADDGQRLPGLYAEADVVQNDVFTVGEAYPVELHVAAQGAQVLRVGRVGAIGLGVEDGEDLFEGGQGALQVAIELAQLLDGLEEHVEEADERDELPDAHLPVDDPKAAVEQDYAETDGAQQLNAGEVHGAQEGGSRVCAAVERFRSSNRPELLFSPVKAWTTRMPETFSWRCAATSATASRAAR
jgi:hypothetical protein